MVMQLVATKIIDGKVELRDDEAEPNSSQPFDTQIPSNIHTDLVDAGLIPDPHLGLNERAVQWVHEKTWRYSTSFSVPRLEPLEPAMPVTACLVFEGLDTFATVYLNGEKILESENMFLSHRVDISRFVYVKTPEAGDYEILSPEVDTIQFSHTKGQFRRPGSDELTLTIDFESALKRGDEIMKKNGGERVTWNGHYSRVFVRKAQYHYGWDWGPSLITCGPWKPIYLQLYTDRIASFKATQALTPDLKKVTIYLEAGIETNEIKKGVCFLSASILSPSGKEIRISLAPQATSSGDGQVIYRSSTEISNPELWYPRQHGAQNLYTATLTLTTSLLTSSPPRRHGEQKSPVLDTVTKRFGIRRVRVVQDPLPEYPNEPVSGGKTFYFEVNNIPIFCGGSNWIPADSFLPHVTRETLNMLLKTMLLERGNQNMVRIWGGGVYESEDFYEICDEGGILVWQDICLACGDYPANLDSFVDSISEEVRQNIARLRWHPSLVIVAGNNEDYQVADEELGYDQDQPQDEWRESKFPGRWLYEKVFPEIIREVCNGGFGEGIGDECGDECGGAGVVYWPGSPWGGEDSTDRTIGDIHQWNIWGGIQAPYQRYPDLGGRFISEFGMISYPCIQTIKEGYMDPNVSLSESVKRGDWNPEAEIVEHHMKAHSFEKRCIAYITENFRVNDGSLEERVYLSQLLQSEAMGYAYRGWRKKWGSRECGGALVWQLNDVWPVTSWAIIDYYLRPKPAFYTISRTLAPVTLILTRTTNNPKPNSKVEALVRSKTTKGAGKLSLHSTPHVYPPKTSTIQVCVSSISPIESGLLKAEIRFVCINTGRSQLAWQGEVDVYGNGLVTLLDATPVPEDEPTVVQALLWDSATRKLVTREADWPQPFKYYTFPERDLKVEVVWVDERKEDATIAISSKRPVKGLVFEEMEGVLWSNSCVDVIPGDEQVIVVKGLKGRQVKWRYYGM